MKDKINELIEEFPELKEDSEKLSKVVYYLEHSKPNIEASIEFKEDLRNRLNKIIELKKGNKKSNWYFLISGFACLLFVFGIFVYYDDLLNLKNDYLQTGIIDNNGSDNTGLSLSNINMEEAKEDINNVDDIEILSRSLKINFAESEENSNEYENNIDESIMDGKGEVNLVSIIEKELIEEQKFENTFSIDNTNVKTQLNDIISLIDDLVEKGLGFSGSKIDIGKDESIILTFSEYCKKQSGIIVKTSKGKVCRIKGKECFEKNFVEQKCEFININ